MTIIGTAEWLVVGLMLLDLGLSDYETMTISSRKLLFYIGVIVFLTFVSLATNYSMITLLFLFMAVIVIGLLIFFRILANADIVVMTLGLMAAFIPFICAIIAYFGFVTMDAYSRKGRFIPALAYMCGAYFAVSLILIGLNLWIP